MQAQWRGLARARDGRNWQLIVDVLITKYIDSVNSLRGKASEKVLLPSHLIDLNKERKLHLLV